MPSPTRRSARATQPPTKPPPPASNNNHSSSTNSSSSSSSSSSSLVSARRDRTPREANANINPSAAHSATPHSRSSEDMADPPRRSKRSHPAAEPDILRAAQDADEEAAEDEEEVTRCLCGQPEYPGPPLSEAFTSTEVQSEDAGGLFIQCDGCSVWQHGGCVGIVEESQSPDKYYCEECRPKQHELHTDPRGQRYSLYLPVTGKDSHRKNSISNRSDEKTKKERGEISRASLDPSGKRRATMRSREHDEEAEQIQRAIEESAREAQGGKRNGKRGRDDSNEDKQEIKRQRRASESYPSMSRTATVEDESDDDNEGSNPASRSKKAKAEATQSARQAEQREKEKERERARAEAAGRRQQRAGRRRGDDDPGDETPKQASASRTSPPPSSQPESPPASTAPPEKVSHKKGAGRRVKRLGNNQYTKHRGEAPTSAAAASPHSTKRPPAHPNPNGVHSSSDELPNTNGDTNTGTPDAPSAPKGRPPKGKKNAALNGATGSKNGLPAEPAERTIPTMARNLDGMMVFIQRAQLEVAADRVRLAGVQAAVADEGMLGAMEIAEQLTRGIREWQDRFGTQGVRS